MFCSELCPVSGFGIRRVEPSNFFFQRPFCVLIISYVKETSTMDDEQKKNCLRILCFGGMLYLRCPDFKFYYQRGC